ncbi:MAG: fibronectin type III domain-containing protein [Coriobacteriia bacterium]|nr:fibronectin type III domain-containing protein [Coriobacteriia bacterium]
MKKTYGLNRGFAAMTVAVAVTAAVLATTCVLCAPSTAQAAVRGTDVAKPASGYDLVYTYGEFYSAGKDAVLKRINAIRKEAYNEGLVKTYKPMKWASELEWIAQTRAAEAAVAPGHTRPGSVNLFGLKKNGISTHGENLAWNYLGDSDAMMLAINQWYDEKADYERYLAGKPCGVIGHYTSLISEDFDYVALGQFTSRTTNGSYMASTVAAEFGTKYWYDWDGVTPGTAEVGVKGKRFQALEVSKKTLARQRWAVPYGSSRTLNTYVTTSQETSRGVKIACTVFPLVSPSWSMPRNSVVSLTKVSGKKATFKGKKIGSAVVTLTDAATGKVVKRTVTVVPKGTPLRSLTGGSKKIVAKWDKQTTQVSAYEVAYRQKGSSTWKYKKVSKATPQTTIRNLKSGKYYYVKVRTYKVLGGKTYNSFWSKTRSVRTK